MFLGCGRGEYGRAVDVWRVLGVFMTMCEGFVGWGWVGVVGVWTVRGSLRLLRAVCVGRFGVVVMDSWCGTVGCGCRWM